MTTSPLICLAALSVAGCAARTPPPTLLAPAREIGLHHFYGSVLTGRGSGDAGGAAEVTPENAYAVHFHVYYADGVRPDALQPLASRVRLILASRGGDPLLPVSELATGARVGSGAAARSFVASLLNGEFGRVVLLDEFQAALPAGVTAAVHASTLAPIATDDLIAAQRQTSVMVSRSESADTLEVALAVDDVAPQSTADEPDTTRSVLVSQVVVLEDRVQVDGDPIVLAAPRRFLDGRDHAFLVTVSVDRPAAGDIYHQRAVARCQRELEDTGNRAAVSAAWFGPLQAEAHSADVALRVLDLAQHHRGALVYLAESHGAGLALDLALIADDASLAAWAQSVEPSVEGSDEKLSWRIERTAYELLGERLDNDDLGVELQALLIQHVGELGHFPGALTTVLRTSPDRSAFEAKVVAENIGFLSTSDPAARVRACDWLRSRGMAPAGYDPLASRAERRAALAAVSAAAEDKAEAKENER